MHRFSLIIVALIGGCLAEARADVATDLHDPQISAIHQELLQDPAGALRRVEAFQVAVERGPTSVRQRLRGAAAGWLRARALINLDRPAEALQAVRPALSIAQTLSPQSALYAELLSARGVASEALNHFQSAILDIQQAYRVFGLARQPRGQAVALQNIAAIYVDARDYDSTLKYTQQSIETYSNDATLLLSAYNNRGIALFELGHFPQAEEEYKKALAAARELKSPLLEALVLQNLGRAQAEEGQLSAADATLNNGELLTRTGPARAWRPAIFGTQALVALKRNQLDRAGDLIEKTFADPKALPASTTLRDFHNIAYQIYRRRGDDAKALVHLEAFKKLDDAANTLAANTNAALMGARFDFANQEVKITRLRADQAEQQVKYRNTLMSGLLTAAGIISALLLIGFIWISRSRNQVRAANASLSITNVALTKALAAKTEFLATTSHEIRTPLNGILGMTQVILAARSLDPALRSRIELVHGAGETMKALVDDILDVAKMETGELRIVPAEMDLKRLLEDAVQVWTGQAETKRIDILSAFENCPDRIIADEVRLRQIIFNLMSNAVKFTDHGHVRLSARSEPDEQAGCGERLVVQVEDTGMGIPLDRQEDIFESFRQIDGGVARRHGGTGLGLAICRQLARAMGGDVTLKSVLGGGTTFTLAVPLERCVKAAPQAERTAADRLASAELLVAEPNPLGQGILRALLTGECGGLRFVADLPAIGAALATGGVDHVLAEGSALDLSPAEAEALSRSCRDAGVHLTLLWRQPDAQSRSALTQAGVEHLVAKPISAPDLLSELKSVYEPTQPSRTLAA